jgi:type IV secretory pathway VirB2 component (pilin)
MTPPKLAADWWIALTVCIHLALGLAMAWIAMAWRGALWSDWAAAPFFALGVSELLLVGMWLGLSRATWLRKLAGCALALLWLTFLSTSSEANTHWTPDRIVTLVTGPLAGLVAMVALASLCCRFFVARIDYRDGWPTRSISQELQFSLRSMIALTVAVAVSLSLRNLFLWLQANRYRDESAYLVMLLTCVAASIFLVWSCLGAGRMVVRIPLLLVAMSGLGLTIPFYLGGPSRFFFLWPAMMVMVALYSAAPLLAVRHCGYRLASVWQGQGDEASGNVP